MAAGNGVRTGAQFIEGIRRHPREVWVHGKRVEDVTTHPSFIRPLQNIARLYDMQHDPRYRDVLTYVSPSSGHPVGTAFMALCLILLISDDIGRILRGERKYFEDYGSMELPSETSE